MKVNIEDYSSYFKPELDALDNEGKEIDKLYNETHQALEKQINRMNSPTMIGSTSPYRDISELSKTLGGIRQTKVSVTHEKIALKKTVAELELKNKQTQTNAQNGNTNELLMRDILNQISHKTDISKPNKTELSDNEGLDKLGQIDPKKLGINENDLKMIEKFKGK